MLSSALAMIVGCLWTACIANAAPEGSQAGSDDLPAFSSPRPPPPEITAPAQAGLKQVEKSGAIRPATQEEVAAWNEVASLPHRTPLWPDYTSDVRFEYTIMEPFTFPPGMEELPRHWFLLPASVAPPAGDPGRACIGMADGSVIGKGCKSEEENEMRLTEIIKALGDRCRLSVAIPLGPIVAVSAQPSFAQPNPPPAMPIDLHVSGEGEVVLVLNNHVSVIWRVTVAAGVHIEGVIVVNLEDSAVEGLDNDVPVIFVESRVYDWRNPPRFKSECDPVKEWTPLAYQGGPSAVLLQARIKALTGRGFDRFYGGFRVNEFDVELP
ncbi:MAG: hypothetical protein KDJ88_00170 [Bauldia sp.]|nr:hypothetical protein [Bauldia sp.]